MNVNETFSQAWDSIKANKIRSSLTLLALVIGVFSLIVTTTAVAVLDKYFTDTMSLMGSDVVNIQRNPAVQLGPRDESLRNRKSISFQNAEDLQERARIAEGMSPNESFAFTKIVFDDEETDPDVTVREIGRASCRERVSFTV